MSKTFPPDEGTVPLSIPATFMHDVGAKLSEVSETGIKVRQYSEYPFPWRKDGGPRDDFERVALERLEESGGKETYHEFVEMNGQRFVRYAKARIMKKDCVDCHNSHPQSPKMDWKVGEVRGALEIIRPLDKDERRVSEALQLALLLSAGVSVLLVVGSWATVRLGRRAA